jgi:hypothetical protein
MASLCGRRNLRRRRRVQIDLNGEKVFLGFRHKQAKVDEEGKLEHICGPTKPCRAVTTAVLSFDEGKEVWVGNAWCSLGDQFSKERGRKISLARALQHTPDREWRRLVWDAYFARAL